MKVISHKTFLKSLIGALIVSALPLSTVAAVRCEAIFGKVSYLKETLTSARDLNSAVLNFQSQYQKNPRELTAHDVRTLVNSFGRKAHTYFEEAGIEYHQKMELFKFRNLKDTAELVVSYPVFTITGSRNGDEIARMIYGVHSNPQFSKRPLTIEYDTLYLFKNVHSHGHYSSVANKIGIGPHVVTQALAGYSNPLRHEIQHYLEQMKVYDGKMTLARISFSNEKKESIEPYDNYFRMDELETHLKDLRGLVNSQARLSRDKALAKNLDATVMAKVKERRPHYLQETIEIMSSLLKNSEVMLGYLRTNMSNKKPHSYDVTLGHGDPTALYLLEGSPFPIVQINTYGVYNKAQYEMTSAELQQGINKVIEWQWNRLQEIKKEFEALTKQL